MVEVNVTADTLESVLAVLPCMRRPTISELAGGDGFAVKAAVPRTDLPTVMPKLKAAGGSKVLFSNLAELLPL